MGLVSVKFETWLKVREYLQGGIVKVILNIIKVRCLLHFNLLEQNIVSNGAHILSDEFPP